MPIPAPELRVFVSSTFLDLSEEREYLVKKVFPEIRQLCREHGVEFTEIDLRWGLTEEESTHGKVIRTCLEEIDRCRPYFIGIIGSRYGWTPTFSDIQRDPELLRKYPWIEDDVAEEKSLVEMEFDYGALKNPERSEFAFFYSQGEHIRSHRNHSEIPKDEKEKLDALRSRIRSTGLPLREFSGPETLGEHIYNDLVSVIESKWRKEEELLPLERERLQHETFATSRRHAYISNPANTKILSEAAASGKRLIVHAESGAGKSALLAYWAHQYRTGGLRVHPTAQTFVIEHYVGIGAGADHIGLLTHIISEIKDHLKLEEEIPAEPEKIIGDFPLWLSRLSEGKTVLIIDALNQLDEKSHHLGWLPEHLPDNISIIASTTSDEMTATLTSRGWTEMNLKPLSVQEREAIIVRFLSEYHKALSSSQLKRIAGDPKSISPLFLRTLLEELRIIGNFDKLDLLITHYISAGNTDDLFQKVLERMEEDYGTLTVREVMSLLFASRKGLSEHELDDIIPISRAKLAAFLMALDYHLHRRDGLLTFFHDYLRRAVEARYATKPEQKKKLHEHIGTYMSTQTASTRRADEEPWQWLQAEQWEKLRDTLVDLPLFEILAERERQYELLGYWRRLEGKYDVVEEYTGIISKNYLIIPPENQISFFHLLSNFYNIAGFFSASYNALSAATELSKKIGVNEIESASEKELFADVCYYQSDFNRAVGLYKECLDIYEKNYGPVHIKTLSVTDSYGIMNVLCGNILEGIQILEDCLKKYDTFYPSLTNNIFTVLNNLGEAYRRNNDNMKASEALNRSITLLEKKYGLESPILISPLVTLGINNRGLGKFIETELCYKRASEIAIKYLGVDHPLYATILFSQGLLFYMKDQKYEDALPLFKECFRIRKRKLGLGHPETLKVLRVMGTEIHFTIVKRETLKIIESLLEQMKGKTPPEDEIIKNLLIIQSETVSSF